MASGSIRIVKWYGDQVLAKVERATVAAIDEVTAEAADDARSNHWFASESGRLEANTQNEPAERTQRGIRGRFGFTSRGGFYGLFLERKTPILRPAGDRAFPKLAGAIRRRMS